MYVCILCVCVCCTSMYICTGACVQMVFIHVCICLYGCTGIRVHVCIHVRQVFVICDCLCLCLRILCLQTQTCTGHAWMLLSAFGCAPLSVHTEMKARIEQRIMPSVEDGADGLPRLALILTACLDPCLPAGPRSEQVHSLLSMPAIHSAEHTGGWRPADAWSISKCEGLGLSTNVLVCTVSLVGGMWACVRAPLQFTKCGIKLKQLLTPDRDGGAASKRWLV